MQRRAGQPRRPPRRGNKLVWLFDDLLRWWRLRRYLAGMSEAERLEAVRAYAEWVRNPPPAPERKVPGEPVVPSPVVPPVPGVPRYPGRRLLGG